MTRKQKRKKERKEIFGEGKIGKLWRIRYYDSLKVKRHVENPNLYGGVLHCRFQDIRVPKRKRKTAMKRFTKIFPHVKVNEKNKLHFIGWGDSNKLSPSPEAAKILQK